MAKQTEKNVVEFQEKCANEIGKFEELNWNIGLWGDCVDLEIKSPIEQILYCALITVARFNYIDDNDPIERNGKMFVVGLGIAPQKKIGKYRVDFMVYYGTYPCLGKQKIYKELIVECDSQVFHERTEKERRYEKQRDRYFISKGLKVFHFTGSEIHKEPFRVAAEILSHVTEQEFDDIQQDSNLE